jgi:hypothetical protein
MFLPSNIHGQIRYAVMPLQSSISEGQALGSAPLIQVQMTASRQQMFRQEHKLWQAMQMRISFLGRVNSLQPWFGKTLGLCQLQNLKLGQAK